MRGKTNAAHVPSIENVVKYSRQRRRRKIALAFVTGGRRRLLMHMKSENLALIENLIIGSQPK